MQPDLNSLKNKLQANRDFIDRIAAGIPGFRGYLEKAENYDADRMIRQFAADKILTVKKSLAILSGDLSREADLNALQDIDSIGNVLEGVYKKVQFAEYGPSGDFSKLKISDEDQNRLLEFDWRLIGEFDEVVKLVSEMQNARGEALKSALKSVKTAILKFEKTFDERKYVIMEVI
ncbi:MAG: hypothetical protein GXY14_14900 [Spirochaetes bacterium]|mgnify:FL=1|nr:hypothetical protein [Spirochaetota bacterium]